jgi:hypothetical protein
VSQSVSLSAAAVQTGVAASSTNSTSTDSEAPDGSAPSSVPTLDASSMPHYHNGTDHDNHDHHEHHEHGEKSEHPHHHPHINGAVADFDKHKNRTGERSHFIHPIEEKVDIIHVDKRLEIDGKPIQLGRGLEIPKTESNVPTFWHFGHGPVVEREADPKIPVGVEGHHGSNVSPAEKMGHHLHHVEREASPEPEPIWLGGGVGPVVTPETPVETHEPIFWEHGPVIHEEREARAIEDRHAGNHNDTELVENEHFNATGKGHPHHEHAGEHAGGHHKNGTEHHGMKPEYGHKPNGATTKQLPDTTKLPITLPTMTPDTYQGLQRRHSPLTH